MCLLTYEILILNCNMMKLDVRVWRRRLALVAAAHTDTYVNWLTVDVKLRRVVDWNNLHHHLILAMTHETLWTRVYSVAHR